MSDELVSITGSEIVEVEPQVPMGLFGGSSPAEVVAKAVAVANALADIIKARNLAADIKGRKHVLIDGWTLLGSMLGVFPQCVWTKPVLDTDGKVQGYEARVECRTLKGDTVSAAEAQCTRDEAQWGWNPKDRYGKSLPPRDDFALRSMAQTRASSKALRLALGFIVVLAGYEGTPAEEMPPAGQDDLTGALEASITAVKARKAAKGGEAEAVVVASVEAKPPESPERCPYCLEEGHDSPVGLYFSEQPEHEGEAYEACSWAYAERKRLEAKGKTRQEAQAAVSRHFRRWAKSAPVTYRAAEPYTGI